MTRRRRTKTGWSGERAVVLGGGISGLLAARVLADAYPQVTVVDRDDLSTGAGPRRGVPQGRHIHALLSRGQQILEALFPGLTAELEAHGASTVDVLGGTRVLFSGYRLRRAPVGLVFISASRPFMEDRIRTRVRNLDAVAWAPPSDVVGLRASRDRNRVTAVRLLRRADGSAEEMLDADLVVDATGRLSRAPAWLESIGVDPPEEERVRVDVGYATRRYRLGGDPLDGDVACLHGATPDHPRGGALARLEDGSWLLTLFGFCGDHPPTDPAAFEDFAASLPFDDLHAAIRGGEPIDDPVPHRFPANVRRRYERVGRLPMGFIVFGDGVSSFNPVYGQGMAVAALQALALRRHLQPGSEPRPRDVMRAIGRVVDAPWEQAIGADLSLPGVEGRATPKLRIASRYVARLHAAAAHDARLSQAFMRVAGLVDRPQALMRPSVALRVARGALRHRGRRGRAESPVMAGSAQCRGEPAESSVSAPR